MAVAFAIKDRAGFNLSACEETLFLDAYSQIEASIQTASPIKGLQDLFFGLGKAVEERAIIVVNEALTTAQLPANLRFIPKPTDWDNYMKTRDQERVDFRRMIMEKLKTPERTRLIRSARHEYDLLPGLTRNPTTDYDRMFADALERIRNGELHPRRVIYAEDAPQPLLAASQHVSLAAPRPERVSLSTLSMAPEAARIAQAANEVAGHRERERVAQAAVDALRLELETAEEKLGQLRVHGEGLRAVLTQALDALQ